MSETAAGLSALPDGWVWTTLEEVSELNPRINKQSINDDLEVTFLPMKRVEELSGKIDLSETKQFSELKRKSYTPFRDGDILFAKVTPCMENGKIAIARDLKKRNWLWLDRISCDSVVGQTVKAILFLLFFATEI